MTEQPPRPPGSIGTPGAPGTVGPLARLRAELAGPRGYRRVDALLSETDAEAAVAALSVSELYELVAEVGFNDTMELIALATPEQIRGCLDIDVWDRDVILTERFKPWLTALIEAGYEKLGQIWENLDSELRALYIQRHTKIWDLTLGEEPYDDSDDRTTVYYHTVDRFFILELLGDEDNIRLTRRILEDLYQADLVLARHTIMAARSEPPAELEDGAYRWRSGRMADLGYVDFYEALDLFQPLELDAVSVGEGTQERFPVIDGEGGHGLRNLPVVIAEQVLGRSFLARALDRVDDPAAVVRIQGAVLMLVNRVLSAARIKPGDLDALRRGAEYATATVALGLEAVARGDLDRAAAALASISLTRLHRIGYTITVKLGRMARALAPRALTAGSPAAPAVEALCAARPWMARELDTPPVPGVRPFESQADVRRAAEVLTRLALRVAIAESLGIQLLAMAELPEPRPHLDDHVRTALVRAMAGGELTAAALTQAELAGFRERCLADGVLTEPARQRAHAALRTRLAEAQIAAGRDHLAALTFDWLGDLEQSLGGLGTGPVDPRFVDGLIVEARRS